MPSPTDHVNRTPGPLAAAGRIQAVDTLRGVALLGILVMNIIAYALPSAAYFSPLVYGGPTGINLGTWVFAHLFFELKMMGIFSMLFGAGLVLMDQRAEAAGRPFGGVYYRRILWLLVIGLVHAYLLWYGDILVTYAICGLLLYPLRRRSPRLLLILGITVLLFGSLLRTGGGYSFTMMKKQAERLTEEAIADRTLHRGEKAMLESWYDLKRSFDPSHEQLSEEIADKRGDAGTVLRSTVNETLMMHVQALPFMMIWRALGMMLLGMALMKTGVFSAERSRRFYRRWVVIGFGLGLPLVAYGARQLYAHDFDFIYRFIVGDHANYIGSILVSMAYVGIVMLISQSGTLPGLRARLAAVGQMALTNYLMQTLICVPIFYGYGLGLFARVDRFGLWGFVIAIWILQLLVSAWWLNRYRFGPAEWLWRSLTYWRRQPMRLRAHAGE